MHLPNGSQIFVESERGEAIAFTTISNAEKDVEITFGAAVTGKLAKGDYAIITASGWSKVINKVVRIKEVLTSNNKVKIEGLNTKNVHAFPAGSSAGSLVKISTWVELPCVQDLAQEGGEQQYYTYQCLSDEQEQQLPTYKSAVSLTYTFAHEFENAIYPILRAADESGEVKALRMYIPKAGEMRVWSGTVSFNEIPQTSVNEMETVSVSVALRGSFASMPADAGA